MDEVAIKEVIRVAIKEGIGAAVDMGALSNEVKEHGRRLTNAEINYKEMCGRVETLNLGQVEANTKLDSILDKMNQGNTSSFAWKIAIFGFAGSLAVAIFGLLFK